MRGHCCSLLLPVARACLDGKLPQIESFPHEGKDSNARGELPS